jgi:exodeoxyribonuclease-3
MRIATWNVNGLRARVDYLRLWLEARRPDVVALQELKLSDEQFPHDLFLELGYKATVYGQKAWNGVAILSHRPATVVARGLPGQEALGSRLVTASVDGLRVTSLYCPNGKHLEHEDFERKLAWFDDLGGYLDDTGSDADPAILLGDFNIVPGPLDSWDPDGLAGSIFHTDAERRRFQSLLDRGLVDLFRRLHPNAREYSWWDYRGGAFHRGHGLRIDLALGNAGVVGRVRDVMIDRDWRKKRDGLTASDHAPVIVELGDG